MNKILITIRGKTLILFYQIKHGPEHQGKVRANYIQVLPSNELARYDLKGLTPEMFCVNIADMVNMRGQYSGQVENERQINVAKWAMSYDEFLQIKNVLTLPMSHRQIVDLLSPIPGYLQETDGQYIEFEERLISHEMAGNNAFSGYRLTILTEEIDGIISSCAYYYLDTHTDDGWQECLPPQAHFESLQNAVKNKLQEITATVVQLDQIRDETDYAVSSDSPTIIID